MNQAPHPEKTSIWSRVWRQPHSRWRLGIPLGGLLLFILGILFWGGFYWALESILLEGSRQRLLLESRPRLTSLLNEQDAGVSSKPSKVTVM